MTKQPSPENRNTVHWSKYNVLPKPTMAWDFIDCKNFSEVYFKPQDLCIFNSVIQIIELSFWIENFWLSFMLSHCVISPSFYLSPSQLCYLIMKTMCSNSSLIQNLRNKFMRQNSPQAWPKRTWGALLSACLTPLSTDEKTSGWWTDRLPTQKHVEGACSADLDMKPVGHGALCNHRVCSILPKNLVHTSVIL